MNERSLTLEHHDQVAVVTLNRPAFLNALNATLAAELTATAIALASDETVKAVVLTGAGRAFCSGADLSPGALPRIGTTPGQSVRYLLETVFNPMVQAWAGIAKPVVVAQNGIAAGGGVGLALIGDFLLMAESASLVQVFVPKLGLIPDLGVSALLPRAIGAVRAQALALTGAPLSATEALAAGAAHRIYAEADLLPQALTLAMQLSRGPARAQAATKELFGIDPTVLREALARETDLQASLADSDDHAEGMAAFAEKRSPRFC
jgi:2-(1,2-epoxy-1,2-dihydrophenyl)acetyl-CoA isomerase